jgi:hypothetical protein
VRSRSFFVRSQRFEPQRAALRKTGKIADRFQADAALRKLAAGFFRQNNKNSSPGAQEPAMDTLTQLQQALQQALSGLLKYLHDVWQWSLNQVLAVPWDRIGDLPGSKVLLLVASGGIVVYFLFRAARELFAAGEKAFNAFVTLLTVFVKTIPPIAIAGLAAAAGAWVVNHVNL